MDGCRSGFTTKQCLQFHYRKAHALSEETMPKIEREIPYTITAYSGTARAASSKNNVEAKESPGAEAKAQIAKR